MSAGMSQYSEQLLAKLRKHGNINVIYANIVDIEPFSGHSSQSGNILLHSIDLY